MSLISGLSRTPPGCDAHTVASSHPMQLAALGTPVQQLALRLIMVRA
jgi:hypothetical protein